MKNQINDTDLDVEISRFLPDSAPLPMPEQILERPRVFAGVLSSFLPSLPSLSRMRSSRS